jgi:hypothetical protein
MIDVENKMNKQQLEKKKEMYSQVIIELEKKLQTQKSELIEKIKSIPKKDIEAKDDDYGLYTEVTDSEYGLFIKIEDLEKVLDTFKQAEKIE